MPVKRRLLRAYCARPQSSIKLAYAQINPYAFAPAIAPHIAAQEADVELRVNDLYQAAQRILQEQADFTLIEGAGGWRVPISNTGFLSDFAIALNLPVILVVGVKLGCINHALLTVEAIRNDGLELAGWVAVEAIRNDGLELAGWVANVIDPDCARLSENLEFLHQHIAAPCLAEVPYLASASAENIAEYLQQAAEKLVK